MSNSVNLSLDVTKTGIQNPLIKVRQGDGGFETLHTTVTSNGEPMDLQGWTITFMGTTSGNHKIVDGNVTIVEAPNGIFDYTPSKAWGMDIGEFKIAYFKFVKGDGSASSANFRVNVIEAVDLTQEEAQNYISVVDTAIAEINQHLTDSLANVTQSIADANDHANTVASNVNTLGNRVDDYNNKLAAIQVGGRNLYLNSRVLSDSYGTNGNVMVTVDPFDSTTNMWHLVAAQGAGGSVGIYIFNYGNGKIHNNSDWSYSVDIKGIGQLVEFGIENASTAPIKGIIGNDWSRISRTGHVNEPQYKTLVMYFDATDSPLDVYIKLPKLEIGNVPTDWTPAPEDAPSNDAQLVHKTGTETIAGDKTFTSPINGNLSGNAATATKWQTARTLELTGDVTGSVAMDGSGNVSMATTGANLVHKTGNEIIGDDKSFTGKVTADNLVSNSVPVNITKTTTSKMWYSSALTAYRTGNTVTIVNNKQDTSVIADNTASTETIPAGYRPSTVLFYPVVYGSSLKGELQINTDGTFTARGAINGQYRLTATYITGDAWPV